MRKQISRYGETVGNVLSPRQGLYQRPDIGEECQLAGIKKALHVRQIGVQPEQSRAVLRSLRSDWQQRILRERESAATSDRVVICVACCVVRNQHVVGVISAKQENAHE